MTRVLVAHALGPKRRLETIPAPHPGGRAQGNARPGKDAISQIEQHLTAEGVPTSRPEK